MSTEISKEEKYNADKLDLNYEQTTNCPKCGIKLPINGQCGNLLCD